MIITQPQQFEIGMELRVSFPHKNEYYIIKIIDYDADMIHYYKRNLNGEFADEKSWALLNWFFCNSINLFRIDKKDILFEHKYASGEAFQVKQTILNGEKVLEYGINIDTDDEDRVVLGVISTESETPERRNIS